MTQSTDAFTSVVTEFKKRLKPEEVQRFQFATPTELKNFILRLQDEQNDSKRMVNLRRLKPFIEAMENLGKVVEVFLNLSEIVAFIWGPMKFFLQTANTMADSLEVLLDAYEHLGEHIPLIEKYTDVFEGSDPMRKAIVWVYEDILEFHHRAMKVFTGRTWKLAFKAAWKTFNSSFQDILKRLRRHENFVRQQAELLHYERSQSVSQKISDNLNQHMNSYADDSQKFRDHLLQYAQDRKDDLQKLEEQIKQVAEDQFCETIHWISAVNVADDHTIFCEAREEVPDSGEWIFCKDQVRNWLDSDVPPRSILWLNGQPGAGKTILASLVAANCLSRSDSETTYFYCRYNNPEKRTMLAIIKSLLSQLLQRHPELSLLCQERRRTSGETTLSSPETAKRLLEAFWKSIPKQYVILDGLDECEKEERKSILSFLKDMAVVINEQWSEPGKLRVLVVSQRMPDIIQELPIDVASILSISEADNKDDIDRYVTNWTRAIQEKFGLDDQQADNLKRSTCLQAKGMFLFAKLVMPNLHRQLTKQHLLRELDASVFPKEIEAAYQRILKRIKETVPNEWSVSVRLLGWVICAKRPLRWREIQGAFSLDIDSGTVNFEMQQLRVRVADLCGPLVQEQAGDIVQLVHSTAARGIISAGCVNVALTECDLTTLCLHYVSFHCFNDELEPREIEDYTRDGTYAFQDYAIAKWMYHFQATIAEGDELCTTLINRKSNGDALNTLYPDLTADLLIGPQFGEEHATDALHRLDNATNAFSDRYEDILEEPSEDAKRDSAPFKNELFHETLELILSHIYNHQSGGFEIRAEVSIPALKKALTKIRSTIEGFDLEKYTQAKQFYGENLFKCPRVTCYYFHAGFTDAKSREGHVKDHDRPFHCDVPQCSYEEFGFKTNNDLKKHKKTYHPGVDDEDNSFAIPELPLTKTSRKNLPKCPICGKILTRPFILQQHIKSHLGERNHTCSECGKAFVRKNDCKRHEKTIHSRKRN